MKANINIEDLFNKAFISLNSKHLNSSDANYYALFAADPKCGDQKKFKCEAATEDDYHRSIDLFSQVIELDPTCKFSFLFRGIAKYRLQDYQGAIEDYTQVIKIDPKYSVAYNNRGIAKYHVQDYQGTIEDHTKLFAFENYPYNWIDYRDLGIAQSDLQEYERAIKSYVEIIEIFDPEHSMVYENRAHIKYILKDYQGAIEDYTKAIEIDPAHSYSYYNRGHVKYYIQDYQGAIEDYTRAIEINPKLSHAYCYRGNAKYGLQDCIGAIEDYTRAIEINPEYVDAYYKRGIAKDNLNIYSGAIEDYSQVVMLDPNHVQAYYNRGITKYYIKDYEGAIEDFSSVITIAPDNANAYFNRGNARNEINDHEGAIEDYSKAIEVDPNITIPESITIGEAEYPLNFGKYKGLTIREIYQGTNNVNKNLLKSYLLYKLSNKDIAINTAVEDFMETSDIKIDDDTTIRIAIDDEEIPEFYSCILEEFFRNSDSWQDRAVGNLSIDAFSIQVHSKNKEKPEITGGNPEYIKWCIENVDDFYVEPLTLRILQGLNVYRILGIKVTYQGSNLYCYAPKIISEKYKFPNHIIEKNRNKFDENENYKDKYNSYDNDDMHSYNRSYYSDFIYDHGNSYCDDLDTLYDACEGDIDAYLALRDRG